MANARLNKELYTDIQKLKLCNKSDAPVRFLLDKSPFNDDDDDEMANARKPDEDSIVLGRIFPNSDIYNQGAYQIEIKLTKTFPIDPPEVRFNTSIYHPNVHKDGKICHDLLRKTGTWTAKTSLVDVVKAVVERIDTPNIEDKYVNTELAVEYAQNRAEFNRNALKEVKKSALPRN